MFKPEEEVFIDLGTNPFLGTLQTTNFFGTLQTYISEAADDDKQKCVLILNQKDPEEISFASPCLAKSPSIHNHLKSNIIKDHPVSGAVVSSASMAGMLSPFKRKDLRNLLKSKDQQDRMNSNDCWLQTNEEEEDDCVLEEDPNIAVKLKDLSTKSKFKTTNRKYYQQQQEFSGSLEMVEVAEWVIPEDEMIQSPLAHIQKNHSLVMRDGHITMKELALKSRLDENKQLLIHKDKTQLSNSEQIDMFGERVNITSKSTLETSYNNNLHSNQNLDQDQKRNNHKPTNNNSKEGLEDPLRCLKYKYIISTRSLSMKKQLNSSIRWQQRSDQCFYSSSQQNQIISPQLFRSSSKSKNQSITTNLSIASPQKISVKNPLQQQQSQCTHQNKLQSNSRCLSSNNSNAKSISNLNNSKIIPNNDKFMKKFHDHRYILESPQN